MNPKSNFSHLQRKGITTANSSQGQKAKYYEPAARNTSTKGRDEVGPRQRLGLQDNIRDNIQGDMKDKVIMVLKQRFISKMVLFKILLVVLVYQQHMVIDIYLLLVGKSLIVYQVDQMV